MGVEVLFAIDKQCPKPVKTYEFSKLENVLTVVVTALQRCDLWDKGRGEGDVGVANGEFNGERICL